MAGVDSTNVPLPEDENDFDLFGPPDPADPAMQQMMLQMMQSQQTMLEMLNKRMDAEEKRRPGQAAVVNPFGPGATAVGSPTHGGSAASASLPVECSFDFWCWQQPS